MGAFFQGLGDSLVGNGVKVMIVRPGFVDTKMTKGLKPAPLSTTAEAVADAIVRGLGAAAKDRPQVPSALRYVMSAIRPSAPDLPPAPDLTRGSGDGGTERATGRPATPVYTGALPATLSATGGFRDAWIEAPLAVLDLGADLRRAVVNYLRRIRTIIHCGAPVRHRAAAPRYIRALGRRSGEHVDVSRVFSRSVRRRRVGRRRAPPVPHLEGSAARRGARSRLMSGEVVTVFRSRLRADAAAGFTLREEEMERHNARCGFVDFKAFVADDGGACRSSRSARRERPSARGVTTRDTGFSGALGRAWCARSTGSRCASS